VIYKGIQKGRRNSKKRFATHNINNSQCFVKDFAAVTMTISKILDFKIQMQKLFPFKIRTPKD